MTASKRRWSLRTMLATLALLACWIWYGVWLGRDGVGVGVIAFSAASFFIAVFSLGALLTLLTTGKDGE